MDAVQDALGALGKDREALEARRESLAAMESEIHLEFSRIKRTSSVSAN